jgi:hypothetical protein
MLYLVIYSTLQEPKKRLASFEARALQERFILTNVIEIVNKYGYPSVTKRISNRYLGLIRTEDF